MAESKNVYQRLLEVQKAAHAPREIQNRFGKGRSAEQILEAYKPVCNEHGLYLTTSDTIDYIEGRHYVIATATVVNVDKPEEQVMASAYARESDISQGLDASQVTGKASSYSKKYALQNLFAIDDTKDADNDDEPAPAPAPKAAAKPSETIAKPTDAQYAARKVGLISDAQIKRMTALFNRAGLTERDERLDYVIAVIERDIQSSNEMTLDEARRVIDALTEEAQALEGQRQ